MNVRQSRCRMPAYAKVIIVVAVAAAIITGLVFLFKSRTEAEVVTPKTTIKPVEHREEFKRLMSNLEFHKNLQEFSNNFFEQVLALNNNKNVIISPLSIEICLAMLRMGAEGLTAQEMDTVLNLTHYNIESLADNYMAFLDIYGKTEFLHMANKIFVNKNYDLQEDFRSVLEKKFLASADAIDFRQSKQAAQEINQWVDNKTNHLIQNIILPDILNGDTMAVLLGAIHFQDEWRTQFNKAWTKEADFYIDDTKTVKVQMMRSLSNYGYKSLPDLDARALQLPYKNSNLSMLVLLPNTRTGLGNMLENLKKKFIESLEHLKDSPNIKIDLYMPKFKADFEVELNESLKKMGMKKAFESGDFHAMLKTFKPMEISKVIHKAFIDVDEVGTKAAAATGAVAQSRSLDHGQPVSCDHPFYYMIVNADFVPLFQGVVVNF